MSATFQCPHCNRTLKVNESLDGKDVKCPGCKSVLTVRLTPDKSGTTTSIPPTPATPFDPDESAEKAPGFSPDLAKRFLSLPWLILVIIFGFLPWCEVGCASKEINLRVNQSGYQALYGGVSSPFDSIETARNVALKDRKTNKEALTKNIETERSDFLMACSPFVALFWVSVLATVLCICLMPFGGLRFGVCLALVGFMVAMLVITIVVGMPLERRMDRAVQEAIKSDPESALMMIAMISSGKTVWFWLVLGGVLIVGATEAVANLLWRSIELVSPFVLASIGVAAGFLAIIGVGAQAVLWEAGLTAMEYQLAQLHQIEQEKVRKAEETEKAWNEEQRQAEEKRQADLRKQREENDAKQKAAELEKERLRLEIERQRLVAEQKERERKDEVEREASKQREADRIRMEAADKAKKEREDAEAKARAEQLEQEEKEAKGPLEKANKLLKEDDIYKNDNAEEAEKLLRKIAKTWPETRAAKEANNLLGGFDQPKQTVKERDKAEEYAKAQVKYANKLIDEGNPGEARERLLKIVKEYRYTAAAPDAKEMLRKLGK